VEAESVKAAAPAAAVPPSLAAVARAGSWTLALYCCAVFLAAALVFAVQPMVAKMLLPSYGGAPAVWAVSLVFFQTVLLGGYAFAHVSLRFAGVRRHPLLQLGVLLLPLLTLPITVSAGAGGVGDGAPFGVLAALAAAAALPFFAVTTASPVLQRWFSATGHASSHDPYFLYAAGNAGSLLGLMAYPLVIEPRFSLSDQAALWTVGYAVFVLLSTLCAWRVLAAPALLRHEHVRTSAPAVPMRTRARWIAMAAIPSSLMVGATTHLSTDVAAVPLLWVIPLALYLLSFVVAFSGRVVVSLRTLSIAVVASALAVLVSMVVTLPIWQAIAIHSVNLFSVALLVHRRLAIERPQAERLTEFYLLLSLGGALGGALTALAAPAVLTTTAEYPIAIVLALLLRPGQWRAPAGVGLVRRNADLLAPFALLLAVAAAAIAIPAGAHAATALRGLLLAALVGVAVFARRPLRFALGVGAMLLVLSLPKPAIYAERTFFGVSRVVEDGDKHFLMHGTTLHGIQDYRPSRRDEPLGYFTEQGPLGQLFAALDGRADRVAVIGLGTGSIAAYAEAGDRFTFYEIDSAVARIASDPRFFTYLSDSPATVRIVLGDGRLKLAEAKGSYDLIILDAFSSDAIPVHLLTREALGVYLGKLAPGGVIALHVTNRHLELLRVAAGVAEAAGLEGVTQSHRVSRAALDAGITPSDWVVVARDRRALGALANDPRWNELGSQRDRVVWTDQSSNVAGVLRWRVR
jgi:hypothetical protein